MSTPPPLEYEQVQPRRPIRWGLHIAVAIQTALYLAVPMVILMMVVPRFEAAFRSSRTELSAMTRLALSISRWTRNEYGWMFLPLLAAMPVLVGLWLDHRGVSETGLRVYRYLMRILLLALAIAFSILLLLACYAPMIEAAMDVYDARK